MDHVVLRGQLVALAKDGLIAGYGLAGSPSGAVTGEVELLDGGVLELALSDGGVLTVGGVVCESVAGVLEPR